MLGPYSTVAKLAATAPCAAHGHALLGSPIRLEAEPRSANPLQELSLPSHDTRIAGYLFPRLLWRNSQAFSFSDCSFKIQRSKESTARVVGYKQLGIQNSLTMEASFAGANFGRYAGVHFTPAILREMGHGLCDSILDYFDPDQSRLRAVYDELVGLYPEGTEMSGGGDESVPQNDDDEKDDDGDDSSSPQNPRDPRCWLTRSCPGPSPSKSCGGSRDRHRSPRPPPL